MNTEIELNVNDYLDLYLFAKKIGDTPWQNEIIEKLRNFSTERSIKNQPLEKDILWKKYKMINEEIYTLYQEIQNPFTNEELQEKIMDLKQQRILLGRQIGLTKGNSFKN
jgi:hypothetical protein